MVDWIVYGLGNPGPGYARTRHNAGHMVVDRLAERHAIRLKRHGRVSATVGEGRFVPGGPGIVLATSNGYMNESGGPASQLANYYSVAAERFIVVHDDLDLPVDTLRLKRGGGHGGHNGLRDIQKALGSPDFVRVRVGIGRPPGRQDPADYVLKPFAASERDAIDVVLEEAADAVELIVADSLAAAQLRYHTKA